ncbi:mitochondrial inner membrane protease subunit 2 isoform X3 [Phacochoerus africanus]|uniref:mitochondrial inner membrane protease subunit 2 isoform X3 n=1 Tax=Phacochoerus africanus TaxID=41426 RepID=UPI001FD8EDDB|nr:mitochondrial inner membrane protease subunit 2 isoform X3 [Phacochoerus africanus]
MCVHVALWHVLFYYVQEKLYPFTFPGELEKSCAPTLGSFSFLSLYQSGMAQSQGWVKRYFKAFCKGFFVAVPVAVTFLDQVACVARVEGASMQPSLNPGGSQSSDVVLLNHWKVRNFEVQRGDIVSLVCLLSHHLTQEKGMLKPKLHEASLW